MSKFYTITIINNQEKNLKTILDSYSCQTMEPETYVFVLDRSTDDSLNMILEFGENHNICIIENQNGIGFMAGYCRDLAYNRFNELPVIFLDGDCVPSDNLFYEFSQEFDRNKEGVIIGSRKLEDDKGNLSEDLRSIIPWLKNHIFNENHNIYILRTFFAKAGMLTWSCCLGITPEAAQLISDVNEKITGSRRIFSSSFDGRYGGEDDVVGIISMFLNIPISSIKKSQYVIHKWHESRKREEFQDRLKNEYYKIEEYAIRNNVSGLKNKDIDFSSYVNDYVMKLRTSNKSIVLL